MGFLKRFVSLLTLVVLQGSAGWAQSSAPTNNVLTRVLMVESQYGRGTIFSLDVDKREYWITAKHILTGAKRPPYGSITSKSKTLNILNPEPGGDPWLSIKFSVIDPGKDIDIVVLAPPHTILHDPLPSLRTTAAGLLLGGDCEFLGFPFGGGWRARLADDRPFWMPYVKHCTVSAFPTKEEPKIWVLDGINNPGFSGGPVIFRTGPDQEIFAVISGFVTEPAEVVSSLTSFSTAKPAPKKKAHVEVDVNSGFIIAYSITFATDAIRNNPIGPLRQ